MTHPIEQVAWRPHRSGPWQTGPDLCGGVVVEREGVARVALVPVRGWEVAGWSGRCVDLAVGLRGGYQVDVSGGRVEAWEGRVPLLVVRAWEDVSAVYRRGEVAGFVFSSAAGVDATHLPPQSAPRSPWSDGRFRHA